MLDSFSAMKNSALEFKHFAWLQPKPSSPGVHFIIGWPA
jgi:hypothetical protein